MASRKPIAQSLVSGLSAFIDPEVHPTVTVEAFFHTFSTQLCEKRLTHARSESEYPRQDSHGEKHRKSLVGNSEQQKVKCCFTCNR